MRGMLRVLLFWRSVRMRLTCGGAGWGGVGQGQRRACQVSRQGA